MHYEQIYIWLNNSESEMVDTVYYEVIEGVVSFDKKDEFYIPYLQGIEVDLTTRKVAGEKIYFDVIKDDIITYTPTDIPTELWEQICNESV